MSPGRTVDRDRSIVRAPGGTRTREAGPASSISSPCTMMTASRIAEPHSSVRQSISEPARMAIGAFSAAGAAVIAHAIVRAVQRAVQARALLDDIRLPLLSSPQATPPLLRHQAARG